MNLRNIYLISAITFKEMIRKGLFYLVLFFSAGIILFSYYMNFFSMGSQTPIIKDFSLSSISFFSVMLTMALCVTLIPFELENKTIYPILSKPVRRYEYILGKFFGVMLLIALNLFLLGVLLITVLYLRESALNYIIFKAAILILAQCMVVGAITILFSFIVTPPVNFSLMFFIYLFGCLSNAYIGYIVGMMIINAGGITTFFTNVTAFLLQAFKIILPTFAFFNIKEAVVHGYLVSGFYVFEVVVYALLYASFTLMLAYLIFENKDL